LIPSRDGVKEKSKWKKQVATRIKAPGGGPSRLRELRRARRLQAISAAVAVVFLLLLVSTWVIFQRGQKASGDSKARQLAAWAQEGIGEDPERSILLAMQAMNATLRFD